MAEKSLSPDIHLVKDGIPEVDAEIGVNIMEFKQHIMTTWRERFSGYQHLKVMTYSFGLPFIAKVIRLFDDAEIIIGCTSELVLSQTRLQSVSL